MSRYTVYKIKQINNGPNKRCSTGRIDSTEEDHPGRGREKCQVHNTSGRLSRPKCRVVKRAFQRGTGHCKTVGSEFLVFGMRGGFVLLRGNASRINLKNAIGLSGSEGSCLQKCR